MALGLVGKKVGMSRVLTEDGKSIPVTVVEVGSNRVTQLKTQDVDGYRAVQITTGSKRSNLLDQAQSGHLAKAKVEAGEGLWEFRLDEGEGEDLEVGGELSMDTFEIGQKLHVSGTSKGKGFAGAVKRHNFRMQDATHGNSLSHRAPGSIGQCQTPGRVFKGKKMAGHMGSETVTIKNLELVKIDNDRNLLLIKGAVPGAPGGHVVVNAA